MVKLAEILESLKGFVPTVMDLGIGVATSFWFLSVVGPPWDRHFRFKTVRERADTCKERGLKVENTIAVGLHFVSAGAAYGIAYVSNEEILRKRTSLLFLASIFWRPMIKLHSYIYEHLQGMKQEAYYPHSDLDGLSQSLNKIKKQSEERQIEINRARDQLNSLNKKTKEHIDHIKEKIGDYKSILGHNERVLQDIRSMQSPLKTPIIPKEPVKIVDRSEDEMKIVESVKTFIKLVFKE